MAKFVKTIRQNRQWQSGTLSAKTGKSKLNLPS
jgi:hypothetical protein